MRNCRKLLAIGLLGACAFVANVGASAASPEIAPTPTEKEPLTFTSESSHVVHLGPFVAFECTSATNQGSFTSFDSGKLTLTMHGCITKSFFMKAILCNTGKETAGTIVFTFNVSFVTTLVKSEPSLELAMRMPEALFVNCETIKTEVAGGVLGKVDGIKKATVGTSGTLNFNVKEGKQELRVCELSTANCFEGKHQTEFTLFESIGKERPEATLELIEDGLKFAKKFEVLY